MAERNQRHYLGEFEAIVLMAVLRLREDAYGVAIRREIETVAGRPTSLGAVYTTLDRMEEKGFVSARLGEAKPERGGKAKRFYKVEGLGLAALDEMRQAQDRMLQGLGFSALTAGGLS